MKGKHYTWWTRRLAALATGAVLLQAGGCAIDSEALLSQVAGMALQVVLNSLLV